MGEDTREVRRQVEDPRDQLGDTVEALPIARTHPSGQGSTRRGLGSRERARFPQITGVF